MFSNKILGYTRPLFILGALMPLSLFAADFSAWQYSSDLVLNTSPGGANVMGDVTNFPVLIRLSADNFDFSQANGNGSDLRFSKEDGTTELPYEIERWDGTANAAEIWVKVDVVYGNNNSQAIKMYWGNSAATTTSSGSGVFDVAANFNGVYHLNETPSTTGAPMLDRTANAIHGSVNGTSLDQVTGIIGQAVNFDGEPNPSHGINLGDNFEIASGTISFWISPTITIDDGYPGFGSNRPFGKSTNFEFRWTPSYDGILVVDFGADATMISTTDTWNTGSWYHIAVSWSGSGQNLYVNGVLQASGDSYTPPNTADPFYIGRSLIGEAVEAVIDEFRVDNIVRTSNWIKLSHENQKPLQTLVEFAKAKQGFKAEYFPNTGLTGFPAFVRLDPTIEFNWGTSGPLGLSGDNFSVRWTGFITPLYNETYTLKINSSDGVRLYLNGQLLIDAWSPAHPSQEDEATATLIAGQPYELRIEFYNGTGVAEVQFSWSSASQSEEIVPPNAIQSDLYLLLTGGTMDGDIEMSSNGVTGAGVFTTEVVEEPGSGGLTLMNSSRYDAKEMSFTNSAIDAGGTTVLEDNLTLKPSGIAVTSEGGGSLIADYNQIKLTDGPSQATLSPTGLDIDGLNNSMMVDADEITGGVANFGLANIDFFVLGAQAGGIQMDQGSGGGANFFLFNPSGELSLHMHPGGISTTGNISAEEVSTAKWRITSASGGPDYVFNKEYELKSLPEVEAFIEENKHLPGVPSAKKMEKEGVEMVELNFKLLEKIEELTLHTIKQQKVIDSQGEELRSIKETIQELVKEGGVK